jgi:hypothetical protein
MSTLSVFPSPFQPNPIAKSHEALLRLNEKLEKFQRRVDLKETQRIKEVKELFCPYYGEGREDSDFLKNVDFHRMQRLLHPSHSMPDFDEIDK